MELKHFIGIDVSKSTLDISVVAGGRLKSHLQIANTVKEIKTSISRLLKEVGATLEDTVFCMEYTGIYNKPVLKWLESEKGRIWLESAVQISKSSGVTRGKNDKVDSTRIAMYAFTNRHQAKTWSAPRVILQKLAALLSQRNRLIKAKKQLKTAFKEQKLFLEKSITKSLERYTEKPVKALDEQIDIIEKEIIGIMKKDKRLSRLYRIMLSIDGVGFVTAAYIMVTTNEFINISEAKKYACYAGVVPFEHSSGSSYRGKARVSSRANKTIKTLLHMSALAAIRVEGELQDYFKRKIEEGKNKMSILNAIRNKLILRIFSCVRRDKEYEKKFNYSIANT
jgi:transposase